MKKLLKSIVGVIIFLIFIIFNVIMFALYGAISSWSIDFYNYLLTYL